MHEKDNEQPTDFNPTWGEWCNLFRGFVEAKEISVVRELWPDLAKAIASAQALHEIRFTLTEEQGRTVCQTISTELEKQGY